jgi:hypothetical protein
MRPSASSLLSRPVRDDAAEGNADLVTAASLSAGASAAASSAVSSLRGAASALGAGLSAAFALPVAATAAVVQAIPRDDRAGRERELRACERGATRARAREARGRGRSRKQAPNPTWPHHTPPFSPPGFRARELTETADAAARDALAREVEYARTSSTLYASVLKEAHGAKGDIAALSTSVEGLAGGISGARVAAAALAGIE